MNAGIVVKGGTGYNIQLVNGREVFNTHTHTQLPPQMERSFPDYSIYPQFDFAVAMTSRGCPNNCGFCHVTQKEGRCAVKVADVKDFWCGQREIVSLDPNITACPDKRDLFRQYRETNVPVDFSQGLDIRLIDDDDIADIKKMRLKNVHFAWDNPSLDLRDRFRYYAQNSKHRPKGRYGTCYVLTNYEKCSVQEHIDRALFRIYALRDMKYDPYVMIYDKPHAPKEIKGLQRWCNNKIIFGSTPSFDNYRKSLNDCNAAL